MNSLTIRFYEALNILPCQVFVPYSLPVCFVVASYPGYQATTKQTGREYGENTQLTWILNELSKNI